MPMIPILALLMGCPKREIPPHLRIDDPPRPQPIVQPTTMDPNAVKLRLCVSGKPNGPDRAWAGSVESALSRFLHAGYRQAGITFELERDESPECARVAQGACFGERGVVTCDAVSVGRYLHAMALVSASSAMATTESSTADRIEAGPALTTLDALSLAESMTVDDAGATFASTIAGIAERNERDPLYYAGLVQLTKSLNHYDRDPSAVPDSPELVFGYTIYEGAANYFMSFLFGHEMGHAAGRCVHEERSWAETSGLVKQFADHQSMGTIVCKEDLSIDELQADECGLRAVERMDTEMMQYKMSVAQGDDLKPILGFLSTSRRIAIDTLAALITIDLGGSAQAETTWTGPGEDGMPTLILQSETKPGYLYPGMRVLAFAALLNELEPYNKHVVRLCEGPARWTTLALGMGRVSCGESGQSFSNFPLLFGEHMPPGVSVGWETGEWNDAAGGSFTCPPPTSIPEWGAHEARFGQ